MNRPQTQVPTVAVSGFANGAFEPLADVFARTVGAQSHGGAALCIYQGDRAVVDLSGGDYREDSIQLLFSVTKAITAVAAALAHSEGLVDLDEPLSGYWPEFDRPSTRAITARWVLSHRSGLASLDRRLTLDEVLAGEDEKAVEAQEPYWEPGTAHGYHAFTFGVLMNGVFRRTVGGTVGEFVSRRISSPLDLDLWIGTPESERHRVKRISYEPPLLTPLRAEWLATTSIPPGTTSQLATETDLFNSPEILGASWPSTSGVASARALARMFAATLQQVDGIRLIDEQARTHMTSSLSRGTDRVLGVPTHFGSGVQLAFPQFPLFGHSSYGHEAAGGSAAFADSDFGISVGYTTNVHPPMAGASAGFLSLLPTIRHCLTADSCPP